MERRPCRSWKGTLPPTLSVTAPQPSSAERRWQLPLLFKDKSLFSLWQKGHLTDRGHRWLAGDQTRAKQTPGVGESRLRSRGGGAEGRVCAELQRSPRP